MKHLIEVTQRDINTGLRSNGCFCPVARAIRRKLHCSTKEVVVYSQSVCFCDKETRQIRKEIKLPKKASEFIKKFDKLKTQCLFQVKPFSFVLGK